MNFTIRKHLKSLHSKNSGIHHFKKWVRFCFVFSIGLFAFANFSGCGSSNYRFANAKPVGVYNDMQPIPVPEKNDFKKSYYTYDLLVQRPIVKGMIVSKHVPARDVNAFDNIPASSWYNPRLGYKKISPEELLKGPQKIGPPQPPFRVAKAKHGGGNPGFVLKDSRNYLYLVKFDPPEFPGVETTTALIVNRLYWGFGYNVPEDYLVFFNKDDFRVDENSKIRQEDVDEVLSLVAPPKNGVYRTTVSLFLKGIIMGPIPATGTRNRDINDKFVHENRRTLRALRVFNAFTNHTDMRIDNSLDVYEGEAGKGFVRHYLLDFGEAFAGHAMEHGRLWDGFNHMFSFKYMFQNLVTLGARVEGWENLKSTPWQSVGTFESEVYNPATWKEVLPYVPIHYSDPEDNYWAAKVLGALTEDHFRALAKAAQFPEKDATEYIVKILNERQRKTIDYFTSKVSPLEFVKFTDEQLILEDRGNILLNRTGENSRYQICITNENGKQFDKCQLTSAENNILHIPLSKILLKKAKGYLIVQVVAIHNGKKAPRSAQFHFRAGNDETPTLVGVVH